MGQDENSSHYFWRRFMKHLMAVLIVVALTCFSTAAFSGDKEAISKNVDEVVAAIDGGKDPASFAADAYDPYVFIMQADGMLVVHPSLAGSNLMEKALPIYTSLKVATTDGVWVKYDWKGKEKNTYTKRTKNDIIVSSGY